MIVLQNNKLVKIAKINALGSISRGYGVFETLRTFENKKLPLLKYHIDRLFNSAKKIDLKIKFNKRDISKMVQKAVSKSKFKFQRIKIIATEQDLIVTTQKGAMKDKASLKSIEMTRTLPEIKSISYLPSILANKKAKKSGYDDALLINQNKEVLECAYANLFWFEGNTLCTRKDQILPGITRDIVIKTAPFKIQFKKIKLVQLKNKEVFMTQSVSLITPITKIDKYKNKSTEKTQKVVKAFNAYIEKLSK